MNDNFKKELNQFFFNNKKTNEMGPSAFTNDERTK